MSDVCTLSWGWNEKGDWVSLARTSRLNPPWALLADMKDEQVDKNVVREERRSCCESGGDLCRMDDAWWPDWSYLDVSLVENKVQLG